ncbi:hypothetical protein ACFSQ3_15740 [Sphingobacterium corticis]|uniref:Uncharacterized protein n=1 Tax=Sphingobacterium corticis TaxID=1812823 RepID=A0ABW5NQ72_9SPHI
MKYTLMIFTAVVCLVACSKAPQPNDELRNLVEEMNFQKDTADAFNSVLNTLDQQNVLFGDFYKYYHYTIQDSCDNVADAKYDDGEYLYREKSDEEQEFLYQITVKAINDYHQRLAIDTALLPLVEEKVVLTPDVKRYINQHFDLQMYIPEDSN